MTRPIDLLRQGKKEELWQMCCGFIDLSLEEFMAIQKRLLLEQIERLKNCELGRKVMCGAMPKTVEEFREQVPLTTYGDYLPELPEKREDVLPAKVACWIHTSGRTGDYPVKWVPYSEDFLLEFSKAAASVVILGFCNDRGDTSQIKEHLKVLYATAPPEYQSGLTVRTLQKEFNMDLLPSYGDELPTTERVKIGLEQALDQELDLPLALPSFCIAVGEQVRRQTGKLPRDLWQIKGITGGGTDAGIFREKLKEVWGKYPIEMYAGTEGGVYAVQTWDYEAMTFTPSLNFVEFIPEEEHSKWQLDHSYQPKTILLDEVKAGENYEVVLTNLHGGILTRYRVGDMITITSLQNEKLNIDIPQMVFYSRADDLIDIIPLCHFTERLVWEAIERTGIPYTDWTVRKEIMGDKPMLHLYLELKSEYMASEQDMAAAIYEELVKLDSVYHYNQYRLAYGDPGDPETVLGYKPVKVSLLPQGAFSSYMAQRQAEGADLGQLKVPHMNPSDRVLSLLGAPRG
jgi:hypothetical protein